MKWIGIVNILVIICISFLSYVYAEDYEGVIVQEVEVTCISAPDLVKLIQKNIFIQPGEKYSQEKIRESIRKIYALNRFSQITVEADQIEGGVRLSFCPVQFKTISKIQITGNRAIHSETIRHALEVNIGDWFSSNDLEHIEQRVVSLYQDHGYYQVQLNIQTLTEEPNSENILLAIEIQEGEVSKIGTVIFRGQTVFSEKILLRVSQLKPNTRFSLNVLEEGIERLKAFYAEKGYLDLIVTDRDSTYNEETGKVDIQVTLIEGTPLNIRFEGNTHITTEKLSDLLKIFTSGRLQEEIIAENAESLAEYYKTKGFAFVKVTYQTIEQDNAPVLIFTIDEGPQVRVQEITMKGNRAFSTKQLRKQMLTDTPGLFSKGFYQEKVLQEDILAIKAFYQQNGYLEADIVSVSKEFSEEQEQVSLVLVIQEGIQTRIADIRILGEQDETVLRKVRKRLLIKSAKPFNINAVTQSIERIKDLYANQGYIKANVEVSTAFSEDNSLVTMTFTIIPGQKFYVGKISIQGVLRTKKVFITRELKVKEGDVYNPEKIRETVRRLHRLGLYEDVTFRRLDPKSDHPVQDMLLAVRETSAKDLEFGFGYSTERGLKASIGYSDKNLLNYAGKGTAQAELSVERPKVTLQYLQPHFFTQDTNLVASVYDDIQKDNDSFDIEKRGGSLVVRHHFSDTLSASLGYYFEQADPSNVKEAARLSELDTKVLNIQGIDSRFSWDIRDDLIQTKKGGFTQLYIQTATKQLGSEADFFELGAQTNWYINLFRDYVLAFSLNGKLIEPLGTSEYVPIYTRYFLGGDNTVRGFEKYSIGPTATDDEGKQINIGGDRLVRFNAELRIPIYSVFGGVIFYDAGANWLDAEGFDSEDFRDAIGAGFRIATPVGPLRIDYGWKLDRQSGESAGKYYITIGSAF